MENLSIHSYHYELAITKKGFLPSKMKAITQMELLKADSSVKMKMEMDGAYSNYNQISTISVPAAAGMK
ncbi:hypothetical protein D1B31_23310 [Neobacillus notoginsengisoli]|uniref:Uncharacterized protein n=1 Tax=Neobacillus notoginsengisoli TaxID=1578198 RepID=A0A417YDN0_9BACI|nr:DUF6612 family protein [Neobacillus notoginsengisoli]RHW30755.1 hypothetical protein D1B31_23310 [Neobacillus notoginsengisoli]